MQKLHLVGFTTDHRALILSVRRGARSGGYVLELDDAVTASVTDALARRAAALEAEPSTAQVTSPPPVRRPESALTVRELQTRLRAGRTVADVAAEAGVDPEWVERFADPVLAEQRRVIEAMRAARFERSRLGPSGLPLGASVYRNLVDRGVRTTADELDRGWTARQGADGRWLVTFTYTSRGKRQDPTWELAGPRGPVRADDRLAAELAYVAPDPAPVAVRPGKPPKVPPTAPTEGDRAASRRVAVARKEAEAQLDEAARAASKRNAELARRAASTPKVVPEPPDAPKAASSGAKRAATATKAATKAAAAASNKATPKRSTTRGATKQSATTKPAAPAKKQTKRAAAAKPPSKATAARSTGATNGLIVAAATPSSRRGRADASTPPGPKRSARAAATDRPARSRQGSPAQRPAKQTSPASSTSTSTAAGSPAASRPAAAKQRAASRAPAVDPVAAVSRAREEAEAELQAFVARRQSAVSAAALASLPAPSGRPVFRADLAAPAGRNGGDPEAPSAAAPTAPRPRRSEPLRAR